MLLAAGADVDGAKTDGFRPIHIAAALSHVNVLRVLLAAGADATLALPDGRLARNILPAALRKQIWP
jgi:ankyrin repeat protein